MATPHQTFRKAIYDKFKASQVAGTVYAAVGGRLYSTVAPANATFPYIVVDGISMVETDTFNANIENLRVQFSIFSDSRTSDVECLGILDKLNTCFDDTALTLTGTGLTSYAHIRMKKDVSVGPFVADKRMMATQDYILTAEES